MDKVYTCLLNISKGLHRITEYKKSLHKITDYERKLDKFT